MTSAHGLRSEFLNLQSTPTAKILLGASMVMAAGSLVANLSAVTTAELETEATLELAMHASTVATLLFAMVAGVVGSTSDYRFGRIDQLLLSEPRRQTVVAIKTAASAVLGIVYGVVGALVTIVVLVIYYNAYDASIDLGSTVIIRPLVGAVIGSALFACFGVGVGTAVRNQPMALGGVLALLLIVQPSVFLGLPSVGKWLPGSAALSLTENPDPGLFGQTAGGLLLVAWTVFAVSAGIHRLSSRGV